MSTDCDYNFSMLHFLQIQVKQIHARALTPSTWNKSAVIGSAFSLAICIRSQSLTQYLHACASSFSLVVLGFVVVVVFEHISSRFLFFVFLIYLQPAYSCRVLTYFIIPCARRAPVQTNKIYASAALRLPEKNVRTFCLLRKWAACIEHMLLYFGSFAYLRRIAFFSIWWITNESIVLSYTQSIAVHRECVHLLLDTCKKMFLQRIETNYLQKIK